MESTVMQKLEKPLLRGRFHEAAAFLSLGACLMLLDLCSNASEFIAVTIYSLSLVGLFSSSAIYHRVHWEEKARSIMRRIDHAAIFALIAGTTTPVFYFTLSSADSLRAISLIWVVAFIGIFQSIFWINAPKWLAAILYVAAGWLGFPFITRMSGVLGTKGIVLMLAGGIIYTIGALIYGLRRPNPWPRVFGYHEIFHLLVAVAAICHFILIKNLLELP